MSALLIAIRAMNTELTNDGYDFALHTEDLNIWAGREVTTVEDFMAWAGCEESYSDASKDANGFRDRTDTSSWTLSDFRSAYASFAQSNEYEDERYDLWKREDQLVTQGYSRKEAEGIAKREQGAEQDAKAMATFKPRPMPANGINVALVA